MGHASLIQWVQPSAPPSCVSQLRVKMTTGVMLRPAKGSAHDAEASQSLLPNGKGKKPTTSGRR